MLVIVENLQGIIIRQTATHLGRCFVESPVKRRLNESLVQEYFISKNRFVRTELIYSRVVHVVHQSEE